MVVETGAMPGEAWPRVASGLAPRLACVALPLSAALLALAGLGACSRLPDVPAPAPAGPGAAHDAAAPRRGHTMQLVARRLQARAPEGTLAPAATQRAALDAPLSDGTALRLADAEDEVADAQTLHGCAELQQRLVQAVWPELRARPGSIGLPRRNLQREHLRRLTGVLLRPASPLAADVRAVHRPIALGRHAGPEAALAARSRPATTRAHLADSALALAEALRAAVVKSGA